MKKLIRGDVIRVSRGLYDHYGVYAGNGRVIHYNGSISGKLQSEPRVEEVSMQKFLDGSNTYEYWQLDDESDCYSPEETYLRARSKLGEQNYDLVFNNCEHFARWCKTGEKESRQVRSVFLMAGALVAGLFASKDDE